MDTQAIWFRSYSDGAANGNIRPADGVILSAIVPKAELCGPTAHRFAALCLSHEDLTTGIVEEPVNSVISCSNKPVMIFNVLQ